MKSKQFFAAKRMFQLLMIVILLIGAQGCDDPVVRPGLAFEGSAQWALQEAQPQISSIAGDAQIYSILGAQIWKDGRLPANTGSWSFICWSPTLKKEFTVSVYSDLGVKVTSESDKPNPPTTQSGQQIPANWVNSTVIFAAIPGQEKTSDYATLLSFNWHSDYPEAPNTAIWVINFLGSHNPAVRWDGQYIGPTL